MRGWFFYKCQDEYYNNYDKIIYNDNSDNYSKDKMIRLFCNLYTKGIISMCDTDYNIVYLYKLNLINQQGQIEDKFSTVSDALEYVNSSKVYTIVLSYLTFARVSPHDSTIRRSVQRLMLSPTKAINMLYYDKFYNFRYVFPLDISMMHYSFSNRSLVINKFADLRAYGNQLLMYYQSLSNDLKLPLTIVLYSNLTEIFSAYLGKYSEFPKSNPEIRPITLGSPSAKAGIWHNVHQFDFVSFYPMILLEKTSSEGIRSLIKVLLANQTSDLYRDISKTILNAFWGTLGSSLVGYSCQSLRLKVVSEGMMRMSWLLSMLTDYNIISTTIDSVTVQSDANVKIPNKYKISQTSYSKMIIVNPNSYISLNDNQLKVVGFRYYQMINGIDPILLMILNLRPKLKILDYSKVYYLLPCLSPISKAQKYYLNYQSLDISSRYHKSSLISYLSQYY